MTLANFGTFVPPPKKQKKAHSAASISKPYSSRRRPLEDTSPVYGDALFQDSMRIEQRITVSFFNLLFNNVRISTDYKFAIEWFPEPFEREVVDEEGGIEMVRCCESYSLYYFKTIPSPLQKFNPETQNQFTIPYDSAYEHLDCILCDKISNDKCEWCDGTKKIQTKIVKSDDFQLLKNRIIQIVKYEFFEEKIKFANIIQNPAESENETNEQGTNRITTDASLPRNALTSFGSFSPAEDFSNKAQQVSFKTIEEENGSVVQSEEVGERTGNSIEEIGEVV